MAMVSCVQRSTNVPHAGMIVTNIGRNAKTPLDPFDARAILDILVTASHASMWTNAPSDSTIVIQPPHVLIQPVPFNVLATPATQEMESHVKIPTSVCL